MRVSILLIAVALSTLAGCGKTDTPGDPVGKRFVVDKIYNYRNELVADYSYNADGGLTAIKEWDPLNKRSCSYALTYANGKVNVIDFTDDNFPQFSHSIHLDYNASGQVARAATMLRGSLMGYTNYQYDMMGRIRALVDSTGSEFYVLTFNSAGNLAQTLNEYVDPQTRTRKTATRGYTFDNHARPDFGLGNIFQLQPLPYFGTEANLEQLVSKNNMTGFVPSGTQWIYTYNENNLPATIETKWAGVQLQEPLLLRLVYKEIK